ncbi:MAG: GcvT family protein [Rhodospirillaceae bacterium]|nr:GcvT family protein [Rhodospirillaceae bacterium]MBT5515555.1 GcvT family protein [Rhodospirillaceae bacterium]MBT6084890.1 GcvT family protein [Rhodospirillaceae bacterium]MBT6607218.1 GcvT family protein [Rhodospirillaceae bacterium]MBT7248125.1 GcvT family protein [Rhodospirillaceae bacterium]
MKSQARVVVIGGGVVGVSTLYHLAKKGWSDVVLVERKELTSGSTWHAAGLLPLFNMSYSVGQLHRYSVELYEKLEAETGLDAGLRQVGNIRLAMNADRMDEFHQYAGVAATLGVEVNFLTPDEIKDLWPLCNTEGLVGGIVHPRDGYIQPADVTQAMARGARDNGAEIYRNTAVTAIELQPNGEWIVKTDKGDITCEHVVSASGNFARGTGAMVGLDIPVIPVEHQYIVTEAHPDIQARHEAGLPEMGVLREADGSWYLREEARGFILGPYEKGAPCCYVDGPSADSEYELFQEDLDRLEPHIEAAINRVPAFGEVGVKEVYNGAICYTPDGNPIVGPAWDLKNFWLNEGHSFGITAAGGAGWQLAEWMVEGAPSVDMLGVDPRRYGDYATKSFLKVKNEEAYRNVFVIHYPDEEREDARPLRTSPCYDRMKNLGAVFGQKFGWERPNWFAPEGTEQVDDWSFRRSKWFGPMGEECKNVAENVGLLDMTAFAKCRISGPGAEAWLDNLVANKLPKTPGRIALCHALNVHGGVRSEFTIMRETNDSFYLVSAGALQRFDHDYLNKQLPDDGSVRFDQLTNQIGVLVLAGPNSRELLNRVSGSDFSNDAFKWLSGQQIDVGLAPSLAQRINFVGELGWELHHPIEYQNHIFDKLMEAGEDLGLKPFGIRAMDSLRIEKSYRLVGTELSIEYAALESGLERFVHPNKGQFIGRDALVAWQQKGFANKFVTLEVHDVTDADALGNNAIFKDGENVGRATGGNYGFRLNKSLALAMLQPSLADEGTELEMDILGTKHKVTVIEESPYDPENAKLRD